MICQRLFGSALVWGFSLAAFAQVRTNWVVFSDGPEHTNDSTVAAKLGPGGQVYVLGRTYVSGKEAFGMLKFDSAGNQIWGSYFSDAPNPATPAGSFALDDAGNAYVTGSARGTNPFPVFVTIKFGPDGDQKWVRTYRGPGTRGHWGSAIAIDEAGNIYVAGLSDCAAGTWDVALIKYTLEGDTIWEARNAGNVTLQQPVHGLAIDRGSNIVVAAGAFTAKYNSEGTLLWARPFGGTTTEGKANAMTLDGAGNIYVTGYADWRDYFTVKYDGEGNELWTARYNAAVNDEDEASLIAVDNSGNVYVSGWSVFDYMSGTDEDIGIATVKYDANGKELWVARSISTEGDSYARGLAVDAQGRVIVTGGAVMQERFRPRTLAYSADGHQLWETSFEAPGAGGGTAVMLAADNSIYIAGGSLRERGDFDIALVKYSWEKAPGLPRITDAPEGQTRFVGQNVSFAVEASGNPELSYQWRLSGRPIAGATNRVLALSNIRSSDSGEYSVVVSNAVGWTISPEVRLLLQMRISVIGYENGYFSGRVEGDPHYSYCIEVSSDLENWMPHIELFNIGEGVVFADDPGPSRRFYRARKEF